MASLQSEEGGAGRHFAFALVKPAQERAAAIELIAEALVPIVDAVVGHPAQHGVTDIGAASILDEVANRVAAARIADQRDARRAGAAFQCLDRLAEFAALIVGGGFVRLRFGIVGSRQRIGEIDREHPLARNAVGFHPPHRRHPQRGVVTIAVHEQDRRDIGGGRRRRGLCEGR
jgi:hypothetical protein